MIYTWIVAHQNELLSFALTILGGLTFFIFRSRVKLVWGRANNSFHRIDTPDAQVAIYTEKHYVQNVGRVPGSSVNVVFSGKPDGLTLWPDRQFTKSTTESGSFLVVIPDIAPKELIIVDTIWVPPNSGEIRSVRSAESVGKRVNFWVMRNYGPAFNVGVSLLFLLGIYFLLSLLISWVLR